MHAGGGSPAPQLPGSPADSFLASGIFSQFPKRGVLSSLEAGAKTAFSFADKTFQVACWEACLASHLTQMGPVFTHKHTHVHNRSCLPPTEAAAAAAGFWKARLPHSITTTIRENNLIPPKPSFNLCPENSVENEM